MNKSWLDELGAGSGWITAKFKVQLGDPVGPGGFRLSTQQCKNKCICIFLCFALLVASTNASLFVCLLTTPP